MAKKSKATKRSNPKRLAAVQGAERAIKRTFEDLPIVDAKADFALVVRTADVQAASGHQKDASNCILAKACAQQLGSSKVMFFRSVAYLDMPDAEGTRKVVRYMLSDDAASIVRAFDRGHGVKGEVMVTLKAPKPSQTLDQCLKRSRRRWQLKKAARKALIKGVLSDGSSRAGIFKRPRLSDVNVDVRNGTGMIHNTLKKAATKKKEAVA